MRGAGGRGGREGPEEILLLVLTILSPSVCRGQQFVTGSHQFVGCFLDNSRARDLPYPATSLREVNVSSCLSWCAADWRLLTL